MAFGIGINNQGTSAGMIRGEQREIACGCWFTSKGEITPLMIKLEDENGEYQTIKPLAVHSREKKTYAGIPSVEFDCTLALAGQRKRVRLIYYQSENRWVMNLR